MRIVDEIRARIKPGQVPLGGKSFGRCRKCGRPASHPYSDCLYYGGKLTYWKARGDQRGREVMTEERTCIETVCTEALERNPGIELRHYAPEILRLCKEYRSLQAELQALQESVKPRPIETLPDKYPDPVFARERASKNWDVLGFWWANGEPIEHQDPNDYDLWLPLPKTPESQEGEK